MSASVGLGYKKILEGWQKKFLQTETIPSDQLINYLNIYSEEMSTRIYRSVEKAQERLRGEQEYYLKQQEERLEAMLHQVFMELQGLAALLEKANNGELPPSDEIAELAGRLLALESTVARMQARQAVS